MQNFEHANLYYKINKKHKNTHNCMNMEKLSM